MPPPTQANRFIAIDTPLGDDVLLLTSFSGQEDLSRLFTYHLELLSERDSISPREIVGKNVTFRVRLADGQSFRYFNGFVSRFSAGSRGSGLRRYQAEIVPWTWFLTRTTDCRIFQNKSVPDIIEQIFRDLGFSDYETSQIKGSHPPWEYCVQYRETAFNFISRLMEQEGIFYYFRHEDGKHTLVLADQKGAYKDCPENEVEYEVTFGGRTTADRLTSWSHHYEFTPGKWAQTDYNFIDHPARNEPTPSNLMMTNEQSTVSLDNIDNYEIFDYPGDYADKSAGSAATKIRMEEDEVAHDVVNASSTCRTFTPGGKFKVTRHDCEAEVNKTFVIISIQHHATEPSDIGGGSGGEQDYGNSFSCMPASTIFRPACITRKPAIYGAQTAVVVGPPGSEIHTDEYGRVQVQFFWDRYGSRLQGDQPEPCWLRVGQIIAGKNWGAMFIPRVGQEVIVTFLEGDPDRPIITSVVYNADQMPPYEPKTDKTKSYIKTNSSTGGEGYNEIQFEDKAGKEMLYFHAQRNMDVRVRNDSLARNYGNRHQIMGYDKDGGKGGDQREMVYNDKHLKVHKDHVEHVGGDMKLLVGGIEGDGNQDIVIKKDKKELIENDNHVHVKKDRNEKVDMNQSLTVGMNQQEKVGMSHALESGMDIHLKAGMNVVIEAGLSLTIKGPGGFINISPVGVAIQGNLVTINSGGAAGVGAGSNPTEPQDAEEAAPTEPNVAHQDEPKSGQKSTPF